MKGINKVKVLLIILGIVFLIYLAVLFASFYRQGKFLKVFGISALSGLVTMLAVNLFSGITGVKIPLNWWTVGTGSFFGVPGVIALLVIKMFF